MLAIETALRSKVSLIGMILVSPVFNIDWLPLFSDFIRKNGGLVRSDIRPYNDSDEGYREATRALTRLYFPTLTDSQADGIIDQISFSSITKKRLTNCYLKDRELTAELHKIRMPVLCITGSNDVIVPANYSASGAAFIPDLKLVEIAAVGHFPFIEANSRFIQEVKVFVNQLMDGDRYA